jgi:hypothetical protein
MYTYEMVKLADEDGKTYACGNGASGFIRYSKEKGFHDKDGEMWNFNMYGENGLSIFIHIEGWAELPAKEMTLEEIEKSLGYPIKLKSNDKLSKAGWNCSFDNPPIHKPVICKVRNLKGYYDGYYNNASCWVIETGNGQRRIYTKDILGWIYRDDIKDFRY